MEERDLPVGWTRCLLGDVVDYGKTYKAEPSTIPDQAWVLELEDIEKDSSRLLERLSFAERKSKSTKNVFNTGDVLYGKLRPYLNKVILADRQGFCSTEIIPLPPGEALEAGYLFYWLKSPKFLAYTSEVSHGINMPRLGTEAGRNAPFVLAPLNEQHRITAKLDSILSAVEACRQRLDGVAAILKRFRQAVLAAAAAGELTREWREAEAQGIATWADTILDRAVAAKQTITYGVIKLGDEVHDGVPCLRTSNVRWLQIETDNVKRIDPSVSANFSRTVLKGGEVLVNVRGTLGGVAVAWPQMRGWNVSREIAVVPVDEDKFLPEFLAFYIASQGAQSWLLGVEKGVAYTGINLVDLRALPVRQPPIREQQEIIRRVQELFALADQLEAKLTTARRIVERLTPALLAKAFRGELVPQDPSDEPASELLAKLKGKQSNAAQVSPRRRAKQSTRRKTMSISDKDSIKAAIFSLDTDRFTFDELRDQAGGDYESLKRILFELLEEQSPVVRQFFDQEAKAIKLERIRP
jgi:type I restriction enzyme S subunit